MRLEIANSIEVHQIDISVYEEINGGHWHPMNFENLPRDLSERLNAVLFEAVDYVWKNQRPEIK